MDLSFFANSFPVEALTDAEWGKWVVGLVGLLILGDLVWRMVDRLKTTPPLHETYASRRDHDALAKVVVDLANRMDSRFSAFSHAGSESREKVYEAIRALEKTTSGLEEAKRNHSLQMDRLERKIDLVAAKIIPGYSSQQ